MAIDQNLVPLVNIKIAGKWVFTPLIMIGFDTYPIEFEADDLETVLDF